MYIYCTYKPLLEYYLSLYLKSVSITFSSTGRPGWSRPHDQRRATATERGGAEQPASRKGKESGIVYVRPLQALVGLCRPQQAFVGLSRPEQTLVCLLHHTSGLLQAYRVLGLAVAYCIVHQAFRRPIASYIKPFVGLYCIVHVAFRRPFAMYIKTLVYCIIIQAFSRTISSSYIRALVGLLHHTSQALDVLCCLGLKKIFNCENTNTI